MIDETITCQRARRGQSRLALAALLGMLAAIAPLCTDLYLPAFPAVAQSLGTNAAAVQLSLTASLLGIAAGQIFIGPISDAKGRKKPLLLSLTLFTASSFLCAFATSIEALIALRFIQGAAGSGGVVLSRAIACDLYQGTELTKFFSLLMMINGIAPILSPVAGGQILKFTDWQGIFFVLGACGAFMLGAVAFLLEESLPTDKSSAGNIKNSLYAFALLLKNKGFMQYVLIHSMAIAGLFAYIAASPFILQTIYGLSPEKFSLCFALNGLGVMLFAQATGRASASFGERRLLLAGLVLALAAAMAVFFAAALEAQSVFLMALPLFFLVSSVGITTTTSFTLAIQQQKKSAGSASGIIGIVSFLFGAAVSPLVGLGGSHTALPLGVTLIAAGILPLILFFKIQKQKETQQ